MKPLKNEIEILLVDDEAGIRKVLAIELEDRGYLVHTASDGQQALDMYDALHPAIVLTDIKMPGMDGIELLKRLKQRDADVEVIMITGHGDMELAIQSLKHEATDYIIKPIDDQVLGVALRRACERIAFRSQIRDYTENLERLVEEKSRRLIETERLAAMGETVAGLAHAVKNIAGALKGGVFVAQKGLDLDNKEYLDEGWRMMRDNVARIEQLSLDLLNIARPARPDFVSTDPCRPLREVCDLMRSPAEQYRIRLSCDYPDRLPKVPMDPEAIHRCLLNLATNALDACRQCSGGTTAPAIEMAVAVRDDAVVYTVRDTGGGMAPEIEDRLFKGFFTTKGSRGTGIGLMLTRKIVESHGGRLSVETRQGVGSTFEIRLPR